MRKILYTMLVVVTGSTALSQQEYTYTFFGDNMAFFNPAAVGTNEYSSFTGSFRKQWVNFEGSPTSGGVTYEAPLKKYNMGLGGMIYQDHIGVTDQTNIAALYSYQLKLNAKNKLAFGVNAGIDLVNTKFNRLVYWDPNDEIFDEDYVNLFVPHLGIGAHYYTDKLYIGISVPRIISINSEQFNSISFDDAPSLVTHYYLTAGYRFDLKYDISIKPSLLLKYTDNAPPRGDISLTTYYKEMIGVGIAYKSLGFLSTFLKYNYKDAVVFGYGFDFSFNPIRKYSKGSHEFMIQYRFGTNRAIKNHSSID